MKVKLWITSYQVQARARGEALITVEGLSEAFDMESEGWLLVKTIDVAESELPTMEVCVRAALDKLELAETRLREELNQKLAVINEQRKNLQALEFEK